MYFNRGTFDTEPLIFVSMGDKEPKKWVRKSDIIWTGPSSITSKVAVKKSYPSFQKFFQVQLGVLNAGPEDLVDELLAFSKEWKGMVIPSTIESAILLQMK
jgi:hypothetical protein